MGAKKQLEEVLWDSAGLCHNLFTPATSHAVLLLFRAAKLLIWKKLATERERVTLKTFAIYGEGEASVSLRITCSVHVSRYLLRIPLVMNALFLSINFQVYAKREIDQLI